ncbi:MAG: glutamine-hydrolyzing carbamoyl-phosphate synthase small subunit [Candidatus Azotimanducaceae bacterium]
MTSAVLALEDGSFFRGDSIGADGTGVGEVVFNTSMTGYQEIITDPSYCRQIITFTYPHIGNTGVNLEDVESNEIWSSGIVLKNYPRRESSWRYQNSLGEYLKESGIVAIAGVDTRRLTRILRAKGSLSGCIIAGSEVTEADIENKALREAKGFEGLQGMDLAKVVTQPARSWTQSRWSIRDGYTQQTETKFKVVAYDFGIKNNILRLLVGKGCDLTIVSAQTTADEVLKLKPDGIFLSNGPGDPEPCNYAISAIRKFFELEIPVFGICLGHQLLSIASGAKSLKMDHGHHGANHPVKDLETGAVVITSQNHGFAIDESSLPGNLECTHRSLFDGTVQGVRRLDLPVFGFQGHPEASPGPQDCEYLFDRFIDLMDEKRDA